MCILVSINMFCRCSVCIIVVFNCMDIFTNWPTHNKKEEKKNASIFYHTIYNYNRFKLTIKCTLHAIRGTETLIVIVMDAYKRIRHRHTMSHFTCGWPSHARSRILVHATIYRRLLIGRDGHLDQSEAYDIS